MTFVDISAVRADFCMEFYTTVKQKYTIFTALHVMQPRYGEEISVCLSVCLSVRLSVTRVIPDQTVERSVQIYIPYERTFILVF